LKVADFIDTVPPAFTMSIEVGINIWIGQIKELTCYKKKSSRY
jgi:hypothetical protein